ncbi:esterase/lipase family protein [Xanthomonas arboricola pv. corylina]|uniref:esterase/lipase family protein n=1 Tax=Xanthomonas arboricola TaxID=56448 RepID=UPI0040409371
MPSLNLARARSLALFLTLPFALSGCTIFKEFGPSVTLEKVTPGQYIALKRGDILTTGQLSAATRETIRVAGLDETECAQPSEACLNAVFGSIVLVEEDKRSAMAELWVEHATSLSPEVAKGRPAPATDAVGWQAQFNAWMQVARESYAYLFFTERSAGQRGFEDRQTQVRDYYNLAVQEVAVMLFQAARARPEAVGHGSMSVGAWTVRTDKVQPDPSRDMQEVEELISASTISFVGRLRSIHRRDGFGAELVAVRREASPSVLTQPDGKDERPIAGGGPTPGDAPSWSEMPSPSVSVLLKFHGNDLGQLLNDTTPELLVYDPFLVSEVELQGQVIPIAANFTAGYGHWLARSGFSGQSLRSLFGRAEGLQKPHVYLMQPYDPKRRVIVMIHGLASSPEGWVNVANELLSDDDIREHFQIWQVYYPTNMVIPISHQRIREVLTATFAHFDPDGGDRASHDAILVGHSMGGVISRLLVSTSDYKDWEPLIRDRGVSADMLPSVRQKVEPMLTFAPMPEFGTAVFIATPHRGTDVAGGRLGRWLAHLVRLPVTFLESFADVAQALESGQSDGRNKRPAGFGNSISNLDKDDPFIKLAADLPMAPFLRYHSIIARSRPEGTLEDTDDGLVPYWSAHLKGADSEKIIASNHSVQETTPAIVEVRRILRQEIKAKPPEIGH